MPRCPSSPYMPNKYSKYDPNEQEYSCETCPSPPEIMIDIGSPYPQNNEESFIEYLQRGASLNDSVKREKYGDLLINLEQCGNYESYGINKQRADINRENLSNRTNVDTGEWSIMNTINQDYSKLNKCYSNSELNISENRICQIIKYYIDSENYLSPSDLNEAIINQFGKGGELTNNTRDKILPPLPEELHPPGGSDIEDYKNFIHNSRGKYITDNIYEFIRLKKIEKNMPAIVKPDKEHILLDEIYEAWIQLTQYNLSQPSASSSLDNLNIMDFFEGQASSTEFEICMNNIFDNRLSQKRDYDINIQERISRYTDITQLHQTEINYIEDKLKIISTMEPKDAMECMNILNIGEMICSNGVSDRMLKMGYLVMHIIGLDKMNLDKISPGDENYQKLKHILDRLTPYIRNAVKQIIKISKYYELQTCGYESASTHILETIYNDVFEKTNEVDINVQGIDLIPTYLIKDTNMMEFAKTIILLVVTISAIYVLMVILNRPIAPVSSS